MSLPRFALSIAIALCSLAGNVHAADAVPVSPADMHVDRLRPGTSTYLVYMHGAPGSGIKRAMLSTSTVKRERVDGADAWTIEQEWEDENGVVHTARTVHAVGGNTFSVKTDSYSTEAGSTTKKDTVRTGIATGAGAIIGGIAGGGKGAAIGAGVGAGAGVGTAMATRGAAAVIPTETLMEFTLSAPATVVLRK